MQSCFIVSLLNIGMQAVISRLYLAKSKLYGFNSTDEPQEPIQNRQRMGRAAGDRGKRGQIYFTVFSL
jgi:hypothetical protein